MYNIWNSNEIEKSVYENLTLLKFLYLNIRTVYSTLSTKIVIILSPILVTLALDVMIPLHYYVGAGQTFVTTLSAGTIWGMTYFSFRKSTIYENIRGTRHTNYSMYLSIFITMLMVTACSEILFWISSIFFYYIIPISILGQLLEKTDYSYVYVWSEMDWVTLIYIWFMQVALMFSGSFVLRGIFHTEKTYFIILFIFVIILLPFGGLIKPSMDYTKETGILINDFNTVKFISIIFPQTCLNYMSFASVGSGTFIGETPIGEITKYSSWVISSNWKWNYIIFYPWVVIIIMDVISLFTIEFIK